MARASREERSPVHVWGLKDLRHFLLEGDPETKAVLSWSGNAEKIRRDTRTFGFFAILTLGVDLTPDEAAALYGVGDEQKKYSRDVNACTGADRQTSPWMDAASLSSWR